MCVEQVAWEKCAETKYFHLKMQRDFLLTSVKKS